ncbi:MAG: hypothetical protein HQL22_09370 [Candidatus Omnitrophica bacterium]|nr:hypothetical protein [Candidatus Omnitrophota bacterium]
MAGAIHAINILWDDIASRNVRVSDDVWSVGTRQMGSGMDEIRALLALEPGRPVSVKDAYAINACVSRLARWFKSVKRAYGVGARVDQGDVLVLDPALKDLMAHYIGNDLYKIALIVDIYGEVPEPLPASAREKLLQILAGMDDFMTRLRLATKTA